MVIGTLQAVASEDFPVPCESSYERSVAEMLRKRRITFKKPVFDNAEGLRPDFILPKNNIIIEVQGRANDEYRKQKHKIHQRIRASEEYNAYRLIKFEANDGQTLNGFEQRLMEII